MIARHESFAVRIPPNDHIGVCYCVKLFGSGQGLYCTPDKKEADWLQEAVEWFDTTKCALTSVCEERDKLKAKLEKLNNGGKRAPRRRKAVSA